MLWGAGGLERSTRRLSVRFGPANGKARALAAGHRGSRGGGAARGRVQRGRGWEAQRWQESALRQLRDLHQEYQSGGDASRYLTSVNALLKSVALQAYPRADVASRFGANWLQIINRDLPEAQRLGAEFNDAVYRKTPENLDVSRLFPAARYWICRHKVAP